MAKDGQVCFHRRLFSNPIKPQRYTTEPQRHLEGINKDVGGATLLLTATFVYILWIVPVSVPYSRHSTTVCVLMKGVTCLRLPPTPATPYPLPPAIDYIASIMDWQRITCVI